VLGLLAGGMAILLSALRVQPSAAAIPGAPSAGTPSAPTPRYRPVAVGMFLAATLGTMALITVSHRRDAARQRAEAAAVRARAAAEQVAASALETGRTPTQVRPAADQPAEAATDVSPSLGSTSSVPLIEFREAPLPDAIRMLARQMKLNCVLDPAIVAGSPGADGRPGRPPLVTARWENITAQQALTTLLNTYHLEIIGDPATGIARIAPKTAPAPATATDSRTR
jgi:hypothetical protein